jgi:hypothetical protein
MADRISSIVEGRIVNLKPGSVGTYIVTVEIDAMGVGKFEWILTVNADSITEAQDAARQALYLIGMGLAQAFQRPGSLP